MAILFQATCPRCGYKSIPNEKYTYGVNTNLLGIAADDGAIPSMYVCSCNNCHELFQRNCKDGVPQNKCVFCGSEDITIHQPEHVGFGNLKAVPCPVCLGKQKEELQEELRKIEEKVNSREPALFDEESESEYTVKSMLLDIYSGIDDPIIPLYEMFPLEWECVEFCF